MPRYYPAKSMLPPGYDNWDEYSEANQRRTAAITQAHLFGAPTGQGIHDWIGALSALPEKKCRAIVDQRLGGISGEGNPVIRLATTDCVYEFEIDHLSALMIRHHLGQAASEDAIDQRAEELKASWR
jgi:hypothetical protein